MPSRQLTEILGSRPARLRRPGGRLPGRAGDDGAVPRAPRAGARHGDRGGAGRGALRLVRGRPPAAPRARRLPLPRRRPRVVPARRLPLLRGHAGRAARGPGGDGGLPARPGAPLSRRAPGLLRRLPRAPGRRRSTRPTWWSAGTRAAACWGWARSSTRGTRAWRCPPASCPSRAGSTSRCRTPSRAEDDRDPVPHRGVGPEPGPGLRRGPGGTRRPAALARLRRPDRPAPALPPGGAVRHAAPGHRGAGPGGHATRG